MNIFNSSITFETVPFDTGSFTKAYKSSCKGYVKLVSYCPIKKVLSRLQDITERSNGSDNNSLMPEILEIDTNEYVMPWYNTCDSFHGEPVVLLDEYKVLLNELIELKPHMGCPLDASEHWLKEFNKISNKVFRDELKDVMYRMMNEVGTDVSFEITSRNVAVKDGRLVLMDVFFSIAALRKARKGI